ncbi:MAG: hypothetical protein DMG86_10090 [Acidobacteria bacterium]|nr:MAG: hypothetical protein DMG86_10090 [Acidobacteriota bacterium]
MSHFTNGLLIANLLIVSSACPAANADSVSSTTVRLYSDVQLSTKALVQAQQEAVRIFRQAGVETVWVQFLVMRIVSKALTSAESIFGMAFLSEGRGTYSDLFYDSVEKLHQECGASVPRVLGHVMAHELGHLLLGSNAHVEIGIMRPRWHGEQLRAVERGTLFFTPEQARLMQYRLSTAKTRTADNAVKAGLAVLTGI